MGLEVSSTSQSASFPFGARLAGVRLNSTRPASAGLIVESPAVTIAPAFLSMLTLHPGVRVNAALYNGIVNADDSPEQGRHVNQLRPRLDRYRQPTPHHAARRNGRRLALGHRQSAAVTR